MFRSTGGTFRCATQLTGSSVWFTPCCRRSPERSEDHLTGDDLDGGRGACNKRYLDGVARKDRGAFGRGAGGFSHNCCSPQTGF
ncbi:hypothetical protein GCK32_000349 [Trichostrongylus colubriformis]|uniref:Uncharacterized protein n=1 Tax=Trichostrongylus colubriformis TaxID=6319 RepID=A0AAN8IPA9_TRICO